MPIDWFPLWLSLDVASPRLYLPAIGDLARLAARQPPILGKDVLDALATLPLALPPTVLGYYLLVVIGR